MISTDKAVNPTNIMGASKRICEMIIQTYNRRSKTDFVAVRFGNVLGSNGSVIPLFKNRLSVEVRSRLHIRISCGIYDNSGSGISGAAGGYLCQRWRNFVLDMGEPIKILDLAKNLILLSGHKPDEDIHIIFTGLRPGENFMKKC